MFAKKTRDHLVTEEVEPDETAAEGDREDEDEGGDEAPLHGEMSEL
jgi:hypothetical protein